MERHLITENGKAKIFCYNGTYFLALSDGSLILRDTVDAYISRIFCRIWQEIATEKTEND